MCPFCSIVAGERPAHIVYRDDTVLALLDIRPVARGHTLVIPVAHASGLQELNPEVGAHMFRIGQMIALAQRKCELAADGANLVMNDGRAAFQTVLHAHLHVVPRRHRDQLRIAAGFVHRRPTKPDDVAAAIRTGLATINQES